MWWLVWGLTACNPDPDLEIVDDSTDDTESLVLE